MTIYDSLALANKSFGFYINSSLPHVSAPYHTSCTVCLAAAAIGAGADAAMQPDSCLVLALLLYMDKIGSSVGVHPKGMR